MKLYFLIQSYLWKNVYFILVGGDMSGGMGFAYFIITIISIMVKNSTALRLKS